MEPSKTNPRGGKKETPWKDEKGVSPVIATILMVAVTVVIAGILAGFVFQQKGQLQSKPMASMVATEQPGTSEYIVLKHTGGDSVDWADLRLSVTENADSPTQFEDPCGSGQAYLVNPQDDTDKFEAGESVLICASASVSPLNEDTFYHVVLRHEAAGVTLLDANVLVTSA